MLMNYFFSEYVKLSSQLVSIAAAPLKCDFAELQQWRTWLWPKTLAFKMYPQITTVERTLSLSGEALQTQIIFPFQEDMQS